MGIFGSLFGGKDWNAELDRAERLVASGEEVRALEVAEKVVARGGAEIAARATAVRDGCREALVAALLAKAERSEAAGAWGDAADWLLSALRHVGDGSRKAELEARREELLERDEELRNPFGRAGAETAESHPLAADDHFVAYVETLEESLAVRYEGRGESFRAAVVDLNEGRVDAARAALEGLLAAEPEDPVLQLETARALLLAGEAAPARELLESCAPALGDGPLDATDLLSVPLLWAEAALAEGDAPAVVARLAAVEPPVEGRPGLALLLAGALLDVGRADDAVGFLEEALGRFPRDAEIRLAMARALVASGEPQRAVAGLEASVLPACAGGRCGGPGLHLPSVRELCRLYLGEGRELERVGELMAVIAQAQGGRLGGADHALLARYYELGGHAEAAAASAAEAERLRGSGEVVDVSGPLLAPAGRRRVL